MKKIISFDLDGTLVHADFGNKVWLEGIPERLAQMRGIDTREAYELVKREYDSVGDEMILWYDIDYWLNRLQLTVEPEELLQAYERYIEPLPHARDVIDELSKKYTLVIASNAARIFVDKEVACAGLTHYFSHIVSATSDYGMVKKEERFYRKLCEDLSVTPAEIVHVGDHRLFDFEVPRRVGMESYHYHPESSDNGNIIADLRELLEKL
jgi:HAD superfamily hydrolase (TIGR01493 family)